MGVDREVHPVGQPLDGALERAVLEGGYATAAVADEVVMVLAARQRRLEPRYSLTHVEALHEAEVREQLECAIDAGQPNPAAAGLQAVGDVAAVTLQPSSASASTTRVRGALSR